MMDIHPPQLWLNNFKTIDELMIKLIIKIWPDCIKNISKESEEDEITREIIYSIDKLPDSRSLPLYIRGQCETYEKRKGKTRVKGRHDLEIFVDKLNILYECKRVKPKRVKRKTKTCLTDKYVTEGLNRFLTGQYCAASYFGGMIGYVVQGDTNIIEENILDAIMTHSLGNPQIFKLPPIDFIERFCTNHTRKAPLPYITINHALIPIALTPQ